MRRISILFAAAAAGVALAASADPPVHVDLLAVLTLRGKPCGSIASFERKGESDYFVTCSDGHHYRVYVGPGDRVVIEDK
jgi:hypothetical protein